MQTLHHFAFEFCCMRKRYSVISTAWKAEKSDEPTQECPLLSESSSKQERDLRFTPLLVTGTRSQKHSLTTAQSVCFLPARNAVLVLSSPPRPPLSSEGRGLERPSACRRGKRPGAGGEAGSPVTEPGLAFTGPNFDRAVAVREALWELKVHQMDEGLFCASAGRDGQ